MSPPAPTAALVSFAVLLSLQLILPVSSQVVVDNGKCRKYSHICGEPNGPTSQKYCCAEGNGGLPIYYCCNPYTGLFIGIGVAVPLIVLLLVMCCVIYVVYARYRRKKLQALLRSYSHRRNQHDDNNATTSFVAPPPYTPVARDEETRPSDSELPSYSEVDQFHGTATTTIPLTPLTQNDETSTGEQNGTTTGVQNVAETETTEIPLEDVPLLSDDENQH